MKKWEYRLSTETIWTSFDCGKVEANTYEEAREKAFIELKYNLEKANESLNNCDNTQGFIIEMDFTQLLIIEI